MAKHNVSELEGALLDAAVAKALGGPRGTAGDGRDLFQPSHHWRDGGPIIQREAIALYPPLCVGDYGEWEATVCGKDQGEKGETPLIAAMRAYVASKFGAEVELP